MAPYLGTVRRRKPRTEADPTATATAAVRLGNILVPSQFDRGFIDLPDY